VDQAGPDPAGPALVSGLPPPPPPPPAGYGPPAGGYASPYGPQLAETAGFWIRFAAAIIDSLIVGIPVAIVANALFDHFFGQETLNLLVGALYFPLQEAGPHGATIGKRLCGIKVVDEQDGQTIDVGRAFVRYLVSLVSGFVCLIGYLWMLWDPKRQTWHDKAARNLVIRVSR
jgi:uncharacterized RDD family membrane protein YckC